MSNKFNQQGMRFAKYLRDRHKFFFSVCHSVCLSVCLSLSVSVCLSVSLSLSLKD